MNATASRRPAEIQAEIDRTRSEMDSTLRRIEQRLTPGQLMDQGLDYLKNSGVHEFASNLGGSVKQNPLPVALVGIGLAWLMATGKRSGDSSFSTSSASSSLDSARDQLGGKLQSARERAGQAAQSTRDMANQIGGKVTEMGQSARAQVQRAQGSFNHMLEEQPLALGAIGLAIGAVLAAAAPRTRKEDELMGEASDRLKEQAKDVAQQKADVIKDKAEDMEQSSSPKPQGDTAGKPRVAVSAQAVPVERRTSVREVAVERRALSR